MPATSASPPLGQYYKLRDLERAGLGNRQVLLRRIKAGELPAVLVGNAYLIAEADLPLLAKPVGAAPTPEPQPAMDDLARAASDLVSTWPRLTDHEKAELGRILSTTASSSTTAA